MVGGRGTDLRGKLGPPGRTKFVGVELQPQAGGPRGGENRSCLVDREHAGFAEYVRKLGEALRRDAGEHCRDEQANVFGTSLRKVAVFAWDFVRAEPGGHESKRQMFAESTDHTKRFQLILGRKPIPRLDFDGRHTARREPTQAADSQGEQLVLEPTSEVAHRGVNPAAAPRDLHVVETGGAELLLLEPRLPENGVRMGIDESRRQESSLTIDAVRAVVGALEFLLWANGGDLLSDHRYGDSGQDAGVAHLAPAPRAPGPAARDDLRCVDEQQRRQAIRPLRP